MPTVTLLQLQGYVLDKLEQNTQLYTNAQITAILNEGYQIINAFTGTNQSTVSIGGGTVTGNGAIYTTPSPIFIPLVVTVNGTMLRKMSLAALARNYPSWATDNTASAGPIQRWAPIGIGSFVIHPMDSVGGRAMTMTGVINPTPLASNGDVLSIEDEFLTMLIEYVYSRIILKEGGKCFAQGSLGLQTFYSKLKDKMIFNQLKFPRYFLLTSPPQ